MKILLFTGAGASVELGVPAMRQMAIQFRDHLHDVGLPPDVMGKMDVLLDNQSKDMEHAIDVVDRREAGHAAAVELGENPDEDDIQPYRTIRAEAEWFVQHACEQVRVAAAVRMWSPTLVAAQGNSLTIASTNYDRAIEIAAARERIAIDDGFEPIADQETTAWRGLQPSSELSLIKLHGSTDWYRGTKNEVLKLRHPMPLFGGIRVIPEDRIDRPLHNALVLPSREKLTTQIPFQALAAEFRHHAKSAEVAIFVGTSLRDPHIRDVCEDCAKRIPTFVASRTGRFEEGVLPDQATAIAQTAGRFLVSTFPRFLVSKNLEVLRLAATEIEPDSARVLEWLVDASDETLLTDERCTAIENLANTRVSLHQRDVLSLIKSGDSRVSIFALGLIPISADQQDLMTEAKALVATKADVDFAAEMETLEKLLSLPQTRNGALASQGSEFVSS